MGNDPLGLVAPGYLADLLLVAGDPFAAVRILEDPANLRAIVQNGLSTRPRQPNGPHR
jgi:imidazolonepropionase-like amidohydrolase